ncbi:hypothetical protein ABPG72_000494 [Tetrahymena utriculariae]
MVKYSLVLTLILAILGYSSSSFISYSVNYADRFHPNQDLMTQILNITSFYNLQATNIQTCVGSVLYCGIRIVNQNFLTNFTSGPYEIVSLVGTISKGSLPHIHIALSDKYGSVIGGHLPSLEERQRYNQTDFSCPIYTTAEMILSENVNLVFQRPIDPQTTFDELQISYKNFTFVN